MGILDDILAVIPADSQKNDAGTGSTPPPADTAKPKEEPQSGWYGKQFRETYMEPKQPQ